MSNLPEFTPEGSYDPNENKEYCSKSLFEQLQEQKNLKLKKFEEENSFKASCKTYDEDDLAFVNELRQANLLKENEKANEVKALLEIAKKKEMERLNTNVNVYDNLEVKIQSMRKSNVENDKLSLLKTMLKRKRNEESNETQEKIAKLDDTENMSNDKIAIEEPVTTSPNRLSEFEGLPGMDAYDSDSDSSDTSSSSDVDVGTLRPLIKRLNDKIKKSC